MDNNVTNKNSMRNLGTNVTYITSVPLMGNITLLILTTSGQDLGFGLIGKLPTSRTVLVTLLPLPLQSKAFS